MMTVEVAYALPEQQKIVAVQVEEGCTVQEAVERSKITEIFPQINPESDPMGVFGKHVKDPKTDTLHPGDRVEIYRPLKADPKAARAKRAAKMKARKAENAEGES